MARGRSSDIRRELRKVIPESLVNALVRRRLAALAGRLPEQRWAAVFASVAHDLLAVVTRPLGAARRLLRDVDQVLLHEAVDRLHPRAAAP
jgi:hypothetical protein